MGFSLRPTDSGHCYSQSELDTVIKNIKAKKNSIILGPEKIGKSTFLLQLKQKLKQSSTIPILYSAANTIDLKSYIKTNLLNILEANKEIFPEPKKMLSLSILELDANINQIKLSDTAKQSLKVLLLYESDPKISMEDVLRHLFTLPQLLKSSVILIDDAELLSNIKSDKASASYFFELLKSGDIESPVVAASSYRLQLEAFEELTLNTLSIDDTRNLLKDQELGLDEKALTTLFNFAEGVPFYLNYFGRLIKLTSKTDSNSITELINDSLSNDLHIYFSEKLKTLSPKELPILFCMAENDVNTPSRISKILNYSQTNVRRFLSIMEEKGFVTLKERGVFEIHDPVFKRWLKKKNE